MPFQFTPYQPDTRSILDLMARGPATQAAALRQGGAIRAHAAQAIGGGIAQSIGDLLQERQRAPILAEQAAARAQDRELRGLQIENERGQLTARQQHDADQAVIDQVLQANTDLPSIEKAFAESGHGRLIPGIRKQFADAEESASKVAASRTLQEKAKIDLATSQADYLANLATAVKAHDYDPGAFHLLIAKAYQHDILDKQQAGQAIAMALQRPESIKAFIDARIQESPAQQKAAAEQAKTAATAAKVTYSAPQPVMVAGKRVLVRSGSDGKLYDMQGDVVAADVAPDVPPQQPSQDLVQVAGPNGTPIWVRKGDAVGKPAAQAPRAVTGQERGVLAFYNRAKQAVDTLTDGGDASLEQRMAKQSLTRQGQLQYAPNLLQTTEQQSYRQAQRAFTEARLRKESGAAINDAEYEKDARTYFAQPGDDQKTIDQKRAARQTVLEGLKFSSGKAYEEYYGEPNLSPARGGGGETKGIDVKDPGGKTHHFDTQAQADEFKRLAGLK